MGKAIIVNKSDGRKLTHSQGEYIRIQSVKAVREGKESPEDVMKTFGLHRSNIYKWLKIYDNQGYAGLKSTKSKGPSPKMTVKQKQQLYNYLQKNPLQLKFDYALWTIEMIVELIQMKFDVQYSSVQVGRILKEIGFSQQKPLERAYQQDPEKVDKWLKTAYPLIKKEAKKEKREIYFSDEAGFHATAQYGSTWAPKGQTPILKTTGQRQKVNCISAINNQGKLRFMLYDEKFTAAVFIRFLKQLMHKQKGNITIIVDGHRTHFTKAVKEYIIFQKGKLKLYQLPPYSPELNPDELVWNNTKQKVAKRKHNKTGATFTQVVKDTMVELQRNKNMVASFFYEKNVCYAM
jgi:transposase